MCTSHVQVELMVARFTNLAPGPPLMWQRGLIGMALGAVPCAFEGLLGFLFDAADGSDYYARKRSKLFWQRHPSKWHQYFVRQHLRTSMLVLQACQHWQQWQQWQQQQEQ
jgi:hypothetical protein